MYRNKFIACVMVDDEIVREVRQDGCDCIFIPFGTDYHLRLKNLDHRRAVVSVSIDGDDVLDGSRLVVDGNSTTDLRGFLDSKANVAHNAFRFIEQTDMVREHRGEHVDDGIVRIEVQFEETVPQIEQTIKWDGVKRDGIGNPWGSPWYPCNISFGGGFTNDVMPGSSGSYSCNPQGHQTFDWSSDGQIESIQCSHSMEPTLDANDTDEVDLSDIGDGTNTINTDGITVSGNVVDQMFTTTHIRRLASEKVVIVFKLMGKLRDEKPVTKPLTVKSKVECPTCGTMNKSGIKFCGECGTCLL